MVLNSRLIHLKYKAPDVNDSRRNTAKRLLCFLCNSIYFSNSNINVILSICTPQQTLFASSIVPCTRLPCRTKPNYRSVTFDRPPLRCTFVFVPHVCAKRGCLAPPEALIYTTIGWQITCQICCRQKSSQTPNATSQLTPSLLFKSGASYWHIFLDS